MPADASPLPAHPFSPKRRRRFYLTGAALLGLLGLTLAVYLLPVPAAWATVLGLLIAAAKAALILAVFMELAESTALVRVAAAVGLVWLLFLFALTLGDYLSRGSALAP